MHHKVIIVLNMMMHNYIHGSNMPNIQNDINILLGINCEVEKIINFPKEIVI